MAFVFANPVFQNYTMKNGLVSNYCYDVLQDKRGYIWVATLNGLCRFNGNRWQAYQQQSAKSAYRLPGNWVMDIDEDKQGQIMINTDRGMASYQAQGDSIRQLPAPVKGWGKILCLGNRVLVSSWSGIDQYRSEGGSIVYETHYAGSENNSFMCLYAANGRQAWACPEDNPSLMEIDTETRKMTHHKSVILEGTSQSLVINSIAAFSSDTLLLSTKTEGVLKYCLRNNRAIRFLKEVLNPGDEFSCSLVYELQGRRFLLAGTKSKGLCCVDLEGHHVFWYRHDQNDPGSLLSDHITAIVPDNNEGLWIATSKGLSFFHPSLQKNKHYYFYNNGVMPPGILINAVYKLNESEFLVGTDQDGLFLHHGVTKETSRIPLIAGHSLKITSFARMGRYEIAVGTNQGLFAYNTMSRSAIRMLIDGRPFLHSLFALRILEGGKLGLCTGKGAAICDPERKTLIYSEITADSSEQKYCKDVFLKGDDLWVLRLFNGYEKHTISTGKVVSLTPKELAGKPIDYHGFSASPGTLFVATSAGIIMQGLAGGSRAQLLKTSQGLEGDAIENVLYFRDGVLYYTTPEGLYRYFTGQEKSNRVASYENYPQKWFNQLSLLADSLLIYTVSDYFMINNPFFNFKNKLAPRCYIEQVEINGKPLTRLKDTLVCKHHENNITIRLAGLVYPESEKNTWYYRIDKADTALRTAPNGEIVLSNLSPDTYGVNMYAVNNEGTWSPKATLWLVIEKPFYNTWWFYGILVLLLLLGIYLPFMYRKAQRDRLIKIRNQISRDLHDELGSNVSSIHIMANMLLHKQKNDDDQALRNISSYSVQIGDTINDIIWNINPKFDSVDELIKKMVRYASGSLDAARINYKVQVPDTLADAEIDNNLKYHIYLLFKEAVNNAAKHSEASLVSIAIDFTDRVFSFSVKDDGIGFNAGETEKGNGLYNMKSRAKEIKAVFTITSALHEGTHIHLTIKLK